MVVKNEELGILDENRSVVAFGESISTHLSSLNFDAPRGCISVCRSIDSTNAEAKRRIADASAPREIPYGSVIIADEQTAGRGRRGRAFCSPAADSVYLSFVLKPVASAENLLLVTIMAAVAVCRAMELEAASPKIKWVNDIYIKERKVCGILTEAVSNAKNDAIESLVLGIGVNINVPKTEFPEDIQGSAGSLHIAPERREHFTASLIGEVFSLYGRLTDETIMREYRARSMMTDRHITVIRANGNREGISRGIADDGGLLVEYMDRTAETLRFGEVSISL
jgi:BirA family biotin operon repressor/biotin-[acetyl-CoA-carboxylase] ligase